MKVGIHSFRSTVQRRPRALFLSMAGCGLLATVIQSCCEVSAASEVESLAGSQLTGCTANHAKGQLSVKVSDSVAGWENELLTKTWNGALKTFVKPNVLSLKSVESVGTTPNSSAPDNIRYVQLDGKFGDGLGVGTRVLGTLFKKGSKGAGIIGSDTITDIQESLEVKSPPDSEAEELQKNFSLRGLMENLTWHHPDAPSSFFAAYDPEEQWSFSQTGYAEAINSFKTEATALNKPTIRVAVLDTGVDVNHPDLKGAVDVSLAYNALTGASGTAESVQDLQGHGTHVAGIIAGQGTATDTMTPVFGVAVDFNVKIVPIKVLGDDGTGSTLAMNKGIRWAQKNKVDIISMSLGSGSNYDCLKEQGLNDPVIDEVIREGIIVVAAAGNESCPLGGECSEGGSFSNYTVLPCANEGALCVASNTWNESESRFSNFASAALGSQAYRTAPDVTAPGDRIISTYPLIDKFSKYQGVSILSGTSMATPYISGIAAILKAVETDKYPVNQETFKKYLQESSYQSELYSGRFQAGRVDLKALWDNRQNVYINGGTDLVRGTEKKVPSFKYGTKN